MGKRASYLLPFRCILFIVAFLCLSMILGEELTGLSKWWSVVVSVCNVITIALLLVYCKKEKITYAKLMHYEKGKTTIWQAIIISILILMVGFAGMYLAGFLCYGKFPYLAVMMVEPIPLGLAVINIFVLPITTTLAEDGLYLGCGVNNIQNKWCAILIPAFFYAIQHSFIPLLLSPQFIVYRFLSFLPLTVLLCWWYHKKRNPLPIMIGHFIINLATVAQIVLTSASPELFEMMKNM